MFTPFASMVPQKKLRMFLDFAKICQDYARPLVLLLLTGCTSLFYQPTRHQYFDPSRANLAYEDVFFDSKDGTKLHGWFFPAQGKAKGTLIQFHGNAENLSSHFASLVWVTAQGYNLFAFDYRGYGRSDGEPTPEGVYEDALAALQKGLELRNAHGKGHYVVYGQSLGGAVVLRALPDFKSRDEVTFLVQDSTFASYKEVAFNRISSVWFLVPISPLAFVLVSDKYASDEVFDRITWPTLVITGDKDVVIPAKFGKKIYKGISPKKKWLWKIPEGSHIDVYHVAEGKYRQPFLELLDQNAP